MKLHSWLTMIICILLIQVVGYFVGNHIFGIEWVSLFTTALLMSGLSLMYALSDGIDGEGEEEQWKSWVRWYPDSLRTDPRFLVLNQRAKDNFSGGAMYAGVSFAAALAAALIVQLGSETLYVALATLAIGILLFIDLRHVYGPRR